MRSAPPERPSAASPRFPKSAVQRVDTAILRLALDPRPPGAKELKGTEDLYRIRVREYRVVHKIDDNNPLILIVDVGNRRDVYRDL
jgi:mRNA interferase RelE/StbE